MMPLCNELIAAVPRGSNYETASGIRREKRQEAG